MRTFYTRIKSGVKPGIRGMIKGTLGFYCGSVVKTGDYILKVECDEESYKIFVDSIRAKNWNKYCDFDCEV